MGDRHMTMLESIVARKILDHLREAADLLTALQGKPPANPFPRAQTTRIQPKGERS